MTTSSYIVEGNLAIVLPKQPARSFAVVNGGKSSVISRPVTTVTPAMPGARHALRHTMAICALLITAAAFLAAGWFASAGAASARHDAIAAVQFETVTVDAGDSLWSIASEHMIDGLTVQETSDAIRDHNDLDSALLQPGMDLKVPIV